MKKPNFFFIGAPKCGTTSMATWLSEHPNIFIPPIKEIHFFNDDHNKIDRPTSIEEYHKLFKNADDKHLAVGDATIWYLYSQRAVPNILDYSDNPKFIVMIRNPVEMAYSLHQMQYYVYRKEDIKDFKSAWRIQDDRKAGMKVPSFCKEPKILLYGSICRLGKQIETLYSLVPNDSVLITVMDDLIKDTRREYLRILEFLGVPDDHRKQFPVYNKAKKRNLFLLWKTFQFVYIRLNLKNIMPFKTGIVKKIRRISDKERTPAPLPPEFIKELNGYFYEDVKLLSRLLKRDLMHWVS